LLCTSQSIKPLPSWSLVVLEAVSLNILRTRRSFRRVGLIVIALP
jgi:hypothetical protein